ncbi:MAG: excinuclease ABC subunit C [Lewinellaceae bacterium]|nr:excinuclease ABC subunit C [Saprospiraceae bacterium]MCB9332968.1 excinuclease ABC subunit C [Lewinellaceae bacterium]
MTNDQFKEFSPTIPIEPGIYKFLDSEGVVLYVGKAKNLRNRLSSYFGDKKYTTAKTKALVKHADRITFTIVDTEADALLLENTLIKQHQPRYNVMLKDEKSPLTYICIKKERFPRVFVTRRVIRDGSHYFGPYTGKVRIDQIADLIRKLFQLRNCALNLSAENIEKGKFKPCLEYHIKTCAAPCVGYEAEAAYNKKIEQIKNILKGNFAAVKAHLKEEMEMFSENLQFEQAQLAKERMALFDDYQGKSTVVNPNIRDVDVFSIAPDDKEAFVNYLKVVNGAVINTYTLTLTKNLDEDPETLLVFAIEKLREKFNSITPEIIVPMPLAVPGVQTVTVPKIGDLKKLLDLSEKNVQYHLLQRRRDAVSRTSRQTPGERILRTLQTDLHMNELPLHIECFDNSNIQGSNPVSSCVVFRNAKPAKRDYRHYNVKTVEGPNDFASMEEVVFRRYKRLLAEGQGLPQLIIIDGGKGQLSAAMKSLRALNLEGKITVVGIAKKLEEIYFPEDPVPLHINKKSEGLKLIQQARNEAHRFAITFHRDQRSRNFLKTELTEISGIGAKTAEKLLSHFGSVTRLREAQPEDVEKVAGKVVAEKLAKHFSSNDEL